MSFLGGPTNQARVPLAEILPDGRKRLTRYFKLSTFGVIPDELNYAVASTDKWEATTETPAGWTGLLLTYKKLKDSERGFPQGPDDDKPIVELVYEQISATTETQTGGEPRVQNTNGLPEVTFSYVMFSTNAYSPQTVGTNTGPSPFAGYYLWEEKCEDDGTLRNITRTYRFPGTVATSDETLNGGKLLKKTITSWKTVPATPSGFTLVGTPVQNVSGYPIYTYTYYSASATAGAGGEISRRYINSEDGTTAFDPANPASGAGAVRCVITWLSTIATTSDPTTGPASFVRIGAETEDKDGFRVWTVTYAYGNGLISQFIGTRKDGLREVTNISLGTKSTPVGVVIRDDYRNSEGYIIYTVTSIQSAGGSATVTGAALSFQRYVPFTYPGRAKPYTETLGAVTALNIYRSPPVDTLVLGTVAINYQTTSAISVVSTFWNPTNWATGRANWVGAYGKSASYVESYKGYRSTTTSAVTLTGSGYNAVIFGNIIYAGTTATCSVQGGPVDPGGLTWTLSAEVEPAFTDTSGTVYYRQVLITAGITAQAALPV